MFSEQQNYFENFARVSSCWADADASKCGCRGTGWFTSEVDTLHACPMHVGPHPDADEHEVDAVAPLAPAAGTVEKLVARFASIGSNEVTSFYAAGELVRVESVIDGQVYFSKYEAKSDARRSFRDMQVFAGCKRVKV